MYTHTLLSYFYVLFFKWIDMFMKIKWNKKNLLLICVYIHAYFSDHPTHHLFTPHPTRYVHVHVWSRYISGENSLVFHQWLMFRVHSVQRKYKAHSTSHEHWAYIQFLSIVMHYAWNYVHIIVYVSCGKRLNLKMLNGFLNDFYHSLSISIPQLLKYILHTYVLAD